MCSLCQRQLWQFYKQLLMLFKFYFLLFSNNVLFSFVHLLFLLFTQTLFIQACSSFALFYMLYSKMLIFYYQLTGTVESSGIFRFRCRFWLNYFIYKVSNYMDTKPLTINKQLICLLFLNFSLHFCLFVFISPSFCSTSASEVHFTACLQIPYIVNCFQSLTS